MRPARLTIQGLRSYRHECVIDFEGRALIAIVGDTGAGKSSILEAITYALYNSTTWNASEVKALIADGAQTMKVELEFLAGGGRWSVLRSTSRGNYPPAVHRIQRLDREESPVLGEDAVRRTVDGLVGMSRKAFLSAVILPQGRFQALLQEETAERTRILKGIFRLGELETAREQADVLRRRAEPALSGLRGRRAALLERPADEAARLAAEEQATNARRAELESLRAATRAAADAERDAAPRLRALDIPAAELERLLRVDVATPLPGLAARAAELDAELGEAASRREHLEREARTRAEAGAAAEYERLVAGSEALRRTAAELGELEALGGELGQRRKRLDAEGERLESEEAGVRSLRTAADDAASRAHDADDAVERQRERYTQVRALLDRRRQAAERAAASRRDLDRAAVARDDAARRVEPLRAALAEAEAKLSAASAEVEDVRRAHAAAHAAQGLHPGDECPICARPLPATFAPPSTAAIDPAEEAVRGAGRARQDASSALAAAGAALEGATQRAEETARAAGDAETLLTGTVEEVCAALPDASGDEADGTLLGPIEDEGRALAGAARTARDDATRAASDHDKQAGALATAREGLARERAQLERDAGRAADRERACRERLAGLAGVVTIADGASAAALGPAQADVDARLERARAARREVEERRRELDEIGRRVEQLHDARRRDLDAPMAGIRQALQALAVEVARARRALEQTTDGVELDAPDPSRLADQAARVRELADQARTALDARRAELSARVAAERERARRVLGDAGFEDVAGIERELDRLTRELGGIEARLAEARRQTPLAIELDAAIAEGADLFASLQELVRLLGDGQFVRYVVARRQRVLLGVASETLGAMSGGRYGFAADFQIVDRLSGQPRSTKTLSGGETFLASLALALSLVEIASRAGAGLDALFLDEGFGSLDANALDEALGALERRAGGGRLVAVVSHVKAVAERIEHVLEVVKPPTGSVAAWREGAEADELAQTEIEAGLLV